MDNTLLEYILGPYIWCSTLCLTFDITLFQIKVNGNDFYTFEHRVPVERVCAMQIAGDVSVQTINIIGVRLKMVLKCLLLQASKLKPQCPMKNMSYSSYC